MRQEAQGSLRATLAQNMEATFWLSYSREVPGMMGLKQIHEGFGHDLRQNYASAGYLPVCPVAVQKPFPHSFYPSIHLSIFDVLSTCSVQSQRRKGV